MRNPFFTGTTQMSTATHFNSLRSATSAAQRIRNVTCEPVRCWYWRPAIPDTVEVDLDASPTKQSNLTFIFLIPKQF